MNDPIHSPPDDIPLLRNRDYLIRFAGQIVSTLGARISAIAFPLLVLALTNSPFQAGVVGALDTLPVLVVGLPAGALVDRWDRKRVAIVCDTGRGLNLASIPLALWLGQLTIGQLYANALIEGVLSIFFYTALQASTRRIVPPGQLAAAAGYDQFAVFFLGLIGPTVGGLLYAAGRTLPFLADALSYGASVISLLFIHTEFQAERTVHPPIHQQIQEGLVWLWRHGTLRSLLVAGGLFQVVRSGTLLVLIVLARDMGTSPVTIGLIASGQAVGGLAGSLLASRLQRRFTIGQISIAVVWIYTALYPTLLMVRWPLLFGAIAAAWTVGLPAMQVAQSAYRQLLVPDAMQGRVGSIARLFIWTAQSLGAALAGIMLQSLGHRGAIAAGLIALVAVALITTRTLGIRRAPHLAAVRPA